VTIVGDLPIVLGDIDDRDVPILLRRGFALPAWPAHKLLFSMGHFEHSLRAHSYQLRDRRLRLRISNIASSTREWRSFDLGTARCWYFHNVLVGSEAMPFFQLGVGPAAATLPATSTIFSRLLHARPGFASARAVRDTAKASAGIKLSDNPMAEPAPMSDSALADMSQ